MFVFDCFALGAGWGRRKRRLPCTSLLHLKNCLCCGSHGSAMYCIYFHIPFRSFIHYMLNIVNDAQRFRQQRVKETGKEERRRLALLNM